jgi:hypothetical protein
VCPACESARLPCHHHPETPLKLLVIGHNPSHHSWGSGYSYSNPSNNFWKLLVKGSIIPQHWTAEVGLSHAGRSDWFIHGPYGIYRLSIGCVLTAE